jgi:DNA-binding MarR family transcriptional regulator
MIPLLDVNWQILPTDYPFNERDNDVLTLIENEDLTVFTFDGLKRRTGIHPETLSRILSRFEDEGIIKKSKDGYTVTKKITKLKLNPTQKTEQITPLLQTYLPSDMMVEQLINDLKGRWFGLLRWLGLSENSNGVTLKWVTEEGGVQITLNIQGTALNIGAKFLTHHNLDLALKASYQVMAHISKLYQSSRHVAKQVSYLGSTNYGVSA